MSDLEGILNDVPEPEIEPEAEVTAEPEAEAQPEPEAAPVEPVQEALKEEPMVPVAALTAMRREMQQLKQQVAPVEPAPIPDVFEDQAGFATALTEQLDKRIFTERLNMSEHMARNAHGSDKVDAAMAAMEQVTLMGDQTEISRIMADPMPYEALVRWHTQQQVAQEIGNDPAAWRERESARIREEIQTEMKAKQAAEMVANAPSLADQTNIGSRAGSAAPTLTPLSELLG